MKILQLNVWTGRIKGALKEFFVNSDFDIICLQEAVWADGRNDALENFFISVEQIKELSGLPYDCRSVNWTMELAGNKVYQGNVILSRNKITKTETKLVHPGAKFVEKPEDLRGHQYTMLIAALENGLNVISYHGYWLKDPLGDDTTIETTHTVANIVKELSGPVVMCGDLNISSTSPAMRELDFLHDLTKENGIKNTLSKLRGNLAVDCDHILVNDEIMVKNYAALEDAISDHKGIVVDFEIKKRPGH